jgi:hypothetical protein
MARVAKVLLFACGVQCPHFRGGADGGMICRREVKRITLDDRTGGRSFPLWCKLPLVDKGEGN